MDAIELLEKDHQDARQAMDKILNAESDPSTRKKLFSQLREDLLVHDNVEEEIFYPAVRSNPQAKELVLVDHEAHQVVEDLLEQLNVLPPEYETWLPKFKVMQECLLRHVQDEEKTFSLKSASSLAPNSSTN